MISRLAFFVLVSLTISACVNPVRDNNFRTEGAGLALHNEATDRNTKNIDDYLASLCRQTGYTAPSSSCPPGPDAQNSKQLWALLVETGYNDIDLRCDEYLTWIDDKRSKRIMVEGGTNALTTLTTGLLGLADPGGDAISYIALSLGFASTIYDSYTNSILLGLEGSAIKEVVNGQRDAHRSEFGERVYSNRPQAIYAMRRYLTFCTPHSILSNMNGLSRRAAAGPTGDVVNEDAKNAAKLLPKADDPAGPPVQRVLPPSLPEAGKIFDGPAFGDKDVETLQSGSCIKQDGQVGDKTRAAVRIIENTLNGESDRNGKISSNEWALIATQLHKGCPAGLRNYYEIERFGADDKLGEDWVRDLARDSRINDPSLEGLNLSSDKVRQAIAKLRQALGVKESYPGYDVTQQVTPALVKAMDTAPASPGGM